VLARNPQDVKVALEILAPGLNIERKLFPRIKAWIPLEKVDDEIYACTSKWLANYSIQTIDLTEQMQFLSVMAQRVLCFEVAQTHRQALKLKQAEADVETLGLIGMAMPEAWYREAMDQRGHWLSVFVQNVFESADILVLPSLPFCVPDWDVVQVGEERFNVRQLLALHHFMGFVNYLGLPSMSLPIGRDSNGRPVSVQLLTRPFSEHVLLELATQSHDTFFSFFKTP
jgi:aspartyl-tRNA(Asn)/glutamyl-tRNA(Gln) amidotransferase subunit A